MILVTGGLGYIASHLALDLIHKGQEVVLVDNLSQSSMQILERLEYSTNLYIPFIRLDVRNTPILQKVFEQYPIEYVIHCAGFKSLRESVLRPLDYYNNNISCLMSVLRVMQRNGVRRLVNLSSLSVYAQSGLSFTEDSVLNDDHHNPYIRTQQLNERILTDVFSSDDYWQILNLRLGNVIGAYSDAQLGEWQSPLPKSVLLNLLQVASGQGDAFELFQADASTADGSVERDFIHILDVSDALFQLMLWSNQQNSFLESFNLCSGEATSILQLAAQVEQVTGHSIPVLAPEQPIQELAQISARADKISQCIAWRATRSIQQAITDQWLFQQKTPSK